MNPALPAANYGRRRKGWVIRPAARLQGALTFPGDKAIAHRAVIIGSLARGATTIENFPLNNDCLVTIEAFRKLGVKITSRCGKTKGSATVKIYGKGLAGLKKPAGPLFVGESGTTLRMLLGVLAGQRFEAKLVAARSLARRPMRRVTVPLRMMGAAIRTRSKHGEDYLPITIRGSGLKAITYRPAVASAQVKSALLFAGLFAKGKTRVIEPIPTRDHTERMLRLFKAKIKTAGNSVVIAGGRELVPPGKIFIPGDISSAAFFMVLAAIGAHPELRLKKISLNPSRGGIIRALKKMGADIRVELKRGAAAEPAGDVTVRAGRLKGINLAKRDIPSLIDELPVLMVAASFAEGESEFGGVGELRVKEADRIRSMLFNLKKMGADIRVRFAGPSEKIIIRGRGGLKGARLKSFGDHRTAMSMFVAALNAEGTSSIDDIACINKSFPGFIQSLNKLKSGSIAV